MGNIHARATKEIINQKERVDWEWSKQVAIFAGLEEQKATIKKEEKEVEKEA